MITRRPTTSRLKPWLRSAALAVLAGLLGLVAAGCTKEKSDPNFTQPPPPPEQYWFLGIWGASSSDVYAVGQPGLIAHFDGADWSWEDSHTTTPLTSVYSADGSTFYACGHDGVILRNAGGGWSRMESGTTSDLFGIGQYRDDIYVAGARGTLRRLSGSTWVGTGTQIIVRDANGAPLDTLDRTQDVDNLTAVTEEGIAGLRGVILMRDTGEDGVVWDWRRRLILGGREGIFSGIGDPEVLAGNFVGTSGGRVFQMIEVDGGLRWQERLSPSESFEAIGGIWSYVSGVNRYDCIVATWGGEVIQETIEPPLSAPVVTLTPLLATDTELTGVWGVALDDFFVCGRSLTLMRYYDPAGGGAPDWHDYELTLPAKLADFDEPAVDKFGRVH
jgi:hypothetical protein